MTAHYSIGKRIWFVFSCMLVTALTAPAQETIPNPELKLNYRELTQRQQLQFKMKDSGELTRPVGILNWDFPPSEFAQLGFDTYPQTFCIEPLIPVVGGTNYGFNIDPFGQPRDFLGLKDDEDGKRDSARRNKYVRELYGKHYSELLKKPETYGPAFQTALWELISETDVPANQNSPFDLTTGTFQSNYANLNASPAHVQLAQTMLRGLNGDDTTFGTNPDLAGRQLVRLNGVKDADGVLAQAQIGLRNIGGTSNLISATSDSFGGASGPGGSAPIGGIGGSPLSGFGGLGGGIGGGIGGGGGFIGGGGIGGGGIGGGDSTPALVTETPLTNTVIPGGINPITTNTPLTSTQNTGPTNPITTVTTGTTNTTGTTATTPTIPTTATTPTTVTMTTSTGPTTSITTQTTTTTGTTQTTNTTQTTSTTTTDPDPNPIPGPPAIVLSFVGVGVMGLFRRFRKSNSSNI